MNTIEKRSPNRDIAIGLKYEDEVRFGPSYFSCVPIGFSADFSNLLIGEDVHWKPDSSSCVMLIFHLSKSDRPPDTELVWVDIDSGKMTSIERRSEGLMHMKGFDHSGKYSYEVASGGRRIEKHASW